MTDEQAEKLLDMQAAHVQILYGIFQCLQAMNVQAGQGKVGTMQFQDCKKVMDSAAKVRQGQ